MNRQVTKPGPAGLGSGRLLCAAAALILALAAQPAIAAPSWSGNPERSSGAGVRITLTPRDLSDGRFRLDATFNTHSGDLADLDLMSATELHVGGRTIRPVSALTLHGHHARGRLEFALDKMPDAFEIVIRGVRNQGDAVFRWP